MNISNPYKYKKNVRISLNKKEYYIPKSFKAVSEKTLRRREFFNNINEIEPTILILFILAALYVIMMLTGIFIHNNGMILTQIILCSIVSFIYIRKAGFNFVAFLWISNVVFNVIHLLIKLYT